MAGTLKLTLAPTALTTNLATNVYNQSSPLIYDKITHIHIANKTASAATFSLWLGLTGANTAGTELWVGKSIAANDSYDYYCSMKVTSTQFLVGGSNTATALTITIEGEQVVV